MLNVMGRVTDAINDLDSPKVKECAEYPKVDVVRMNPTAVSLQEVSLLYF